MEDGSRHDVTHWFMAFCEEALSGAFSKTTTENVFHADFYANRCIFAASFHLLVATEGNAGMRLHAGFARGRCVRLYPAGAAHML